MKWLEYFSQIPFDTYRVSLALITRVQADIGVGLTINELSRLSGMSILVVEEALKELKKTPEEVPFLTLQKKGTHYILKINKFYVGNLPSVPFTYDDTDQSRIAMLERELLNQRATTRHVDVSGLAEVVGEGDALLVAEIERTLGRAITLTEAFFLGKLTVSYGSNRVLQVFRQQRKAKEPLRVTYIILTRGRLGKPQSTAPPRNITYPEL